jgi:serine/threonine protein phosphatase PrpC
MQGWRKSNEDAHISITDLVPGVHLFAVFDGHGGKEVAIYCERHMPKMLLASDDFHKQNYEVALRQLFLKIDMQLVSK